MIHLNPHDTIAAIATPPGPALRGILRVSGPDAWRIARSLSADGHPSSIVVPRRPAIQPVRWRIAGSSRTFPGHFAFWPGPRTYTGEPLAELHLAGSPPLLQGLLEGCLTAGARPAEPGEFTLRAFLNGRLDLTQAEAVLGVIEARTAAQLDAALSQLAGGVAGPIFQLRNRLLDVLAHLEASLDFVDEDDVDPIGRAALIAATREALDETVRLAERFRERDRPGAILPRVVLVGRPNAGKSRLFNALIGEARAIVSHVAGTTRDYLTAPCDFDGVAGELVDTAGIEDPDHPIGLRAQELRAEEEARADLILACRAADDPDDEPLPISNRVLAVATKCDLGTAPHGSIATSALTGTGLDGLRRAVGFALRRHLTEGDSLSDAAARYRDNLGRAIASLATAVELLRGSKDEELVAFEIRQAIDELGQIVGAVFTDDILDRIFSRFCIGK